MMNLECNEFLFYSLLNYTWWWIHNIVSNLLYKEFREEYDDTIYINVNQQTKQVFFLSIDPQVGMEMYPVYDWLPKDPTWKTGMSLEIRQVYLFGLRLDSQLHTIW